jgi:ribosomal 50S subunit-recycling heat shock protein
MNRGYTKGFLLGNEPEHNFIDSHSLATQQFVGEVLEVNENLLKIKAHNAIYENEKIEIFTKEKNISCKVEEIFDDNMNKVESAHGGHYKFYFLKINKKGIKPMSLIKKIV